MIDKGKRMDILHKAVAEMIQKMVEESGAANDEEISKVIEETLPGAISKVSKLIHETLMHNSAAMLAERRKSTNAFCRRNLKRWKPAFDLFETYIVICTEAGEQFNKALRPKAVEKCDITFDLVVRHHARACHIAEEILCLLKCGFADGAHARWRALHEVAVTAMFIGKHGDQCAERFYWHEIVESYKGMLIHKEYENRLQEKGPSTEDIAEYKIMYESLIEKFGKDFSQPYGWASFILPNKKVTFADIEKDVGLDHMRPYYKWASQNIHSGAKGIRKKLGLCEATEDILLVGRSNSGMTDPAHATAISLAQVTSALLVLEPNTDRLVELNIIQQMEEEIGQIFLKCGNKRKS